MPLFCSPLSPSLPLTLEGVHSLDWAVAVQNLEKSNSVREKQWRHDSMSDVEEGQALEEEQKEEEVGGYYKQGI